MTTLELKLELPDQLAKEAEKAGLLNSDAVTRLLKDAMRAQVAQALLQGAHRATKAGRRPLSMDQIQREVEAVRRARKSRRTGKPA